MSARVSDFLVNRLGAWGVRRVFGYPGDGINGVIGAIARCTDRIEFVQARHEEMAAFMACGHAKITGEVGTCIATSGPGAIHLLAGLYDAKVDRQPVVAIVGQKARTVLGSSYQQEVDLMALFKDVAHEFLQIITTAPQARHVVDRAYRTAIALRTPTCIIIPSDVQELAYKAPAHEHGTTHSGTGYAAPCVVPAHDELLRAAEILNAGKRVAMLIGAGARHAGREVLQTADVLGAGIAKALLGKPVIADDMANVTGGIGLLGSSATHSMMMECDTLLMVGSSFPYAEFLPEEGQARGVQIDIDPTSLGLRYPMEINLSGDSALTLRALQPLLRRKTERSWRATIESNTAKWWKTLEKRAMQDAEPLNPQRVLWELSPRLPDRAMVACDTGSIVHWYSRDLKLREGMDAAHSGNLASMGAAMPYAIAAKFAHPDRIALALVGDGAMQMNGLNELITVARYWRQWADPRFVVLVLNNRDLNMVSWEQRVMEGNPRFPQSQDLPDFSYAEFANLLGFGAAVIDQPSMAGPVWEQAFRSDRPFLVEAITDPNVPPLPPHISPKQAKNYMMAIAKGDPDARKIVTASLKEIFA